MADNKYPPLIRAVLAKNIVECRRLIETGEAKIRWLIFNVLCRYEHELPSSLKPLHKYRRSEKTSFRFLSANKTAVNLAFDITFDW